ncbi:superoxide dismutase-like [Cu-Zn] [Leptotrombidium deliense]|uniref:Superoxide dismutase-like [Cu-Zn] n=1 Tax=Leptotrombidium deliense TaxID=299467 RepID=A0A443S6V8_9ACAR|nr:superoxide dismutase-like [Cu-Zn] [Leptotrombidium deliense]
MNTSCVSGYICKLVSHNDGCEQKKCFANLIFDNKTIQGKLTIKDMDGFYRLQGHFSGLEYGEYPLHIHLPKYCANTIKIYNPLNETLRCPGSPYMIGDLHRLVVGRNGRAVFQLDKLGQIFHPFNINGKTIVVHDKLKVEPAVYRDDATDMIIGYPGKKTI